ncbi:MGH1-like glycoside hydrolase domain-containing protein [Nonomuraea solani]|uniref:MGH1-like glycoside hydrolase domain-containing protein n=1 Tax=Nonomuraea solani TaxID=1144553 RepID=UPI000CDF10DC|nr:glycosyl hydrolase family 65 protein [Nonomuraea solani]
MLTCPRPDLVAVYEAALHNLLDVNTIGGIIRAGGGYPAPWTRDASINAWYAASLLSPDAARDTLLAVTGETLVQQDDQWWDQIIWAVAAWNHVVVTGDEDFLARAYPIAAATMEVLDKERLDGRYGLYRGGAVMQDGISGYPEPPNDPGIESSFVLDYPRAHSIMCLSTNAVYAGAHRALARMAAALGADGRPHLARADATRAAVNRWLWREDAGLYGYFLSEDGRLDPHQEALGLAMAILFGVADERRAALIAANTHREPRGVVNVWPHFDRYGPGRPGRHNAICWPMVMGVWGDAMARSGHANRFHETLDDLIGLFGGDGLSEVYNAITGLPDGGWQQGRQWPSEPDQTWSATTMLGLVHHGLFGIRLTPEGMRFSPMMPAHWRDAALNGLRYRDMTLRITVSGGGTTVRSVRLDGREVDLVPATLTGHHDVRLTLG